MTNYLGSNVISFGAKVLVLILWSNIFVAKIITNRLLVIVEPIS